jgi:hypothetical protein
MAYTRKMNWKVWTAWLAFVGVILLLSIFQVSRSRTALLVAAVAFLFALWRFPFARTSGVLSFLVAGVFIFSHLVFAFAAFLLGNPLHLTTWSIYAAGGVGFCVHACLVLALGRRHA